jgi:leucyl/phenylalanyl-tRNA--protein transferase
MPSKFTLPDPRTVDDDVIAVGGDLSPGTILQAYRHGMFPMPLPDGRLAWWSPQERAILPLGDLKISKSLRQSVRKFSISMDTEFSSVIDACADPSRPQGWITEGIRDAYVELHRLGWAHSVEVWDSDGNLAGGLYGVSIGGLFAGESMFYQVSDASKVALVHLVVVLSSIPGCLLDVQWLTPHLERMGARAIGRHRYFELLPGALQVTSPFEGGGR